MPLRPHHLLCINFFVGKGYDDNFTSNMQSIVTQLRSNPRQVITLVCGEDLICRCCPNLIKGLCNSQEKVQSYDSRVLEMCDLLPGQKYEYHFLSQQVKEQILYKDALSSICGDCAWFSFCSSAQKSLDRNNG